MEDSPTLGFRAEHLYLVQHLDSQAHDLGQYRGTRIKRGVSSQPDNGSEDDHDPCC